MSLWSLEDIIHLETQAAHAHNHFQTRLFNEQKTIEDAVHAIESIRRLFDAWMERHGRSYSTVTEYEHRLSIFWQNAHHVLKHNTAFLAGWTTYATTLEYSPFADTTHEEFASTHLMTEWQNCSATRDTSTASSGSRNSLRDTFELPPRSELPSWTDWRTKGVLTPVKNQKGCGSCWTFSTSGTLEAHTCLHTNPRKDCSQWTGLAEQQLLDCSWDFDNHGCSGGLPSHAFEYLKEAGGMATEENYPYRALDSHACHLPAPDDFVAPVAAVYNVSSRDEDDLVNAIAFLGPVSVAYQVASDFRLYSHGVYDSFNATTNTTVCSDDNQSVNHAVVAVGYGETDTGIPFYIVRNSWSVSWGMEGHFWIQRGRNLCGISDCASFPIVPTADYYVVNNKDGSDTTETRNFLRTRPGDTVLNESFTQSKS